MRVRQAAGLVLICAVAVAATDVTMQSSLLRTLFPRIESPADGAITVAPVTVRWDGPQPLHATLTGGGMRVDLGLRESPFQIDAARFPRPGQYGIELRAPRLGGLVGASRRFMVRRPGRESPASEAPSPAEEPPSNAALGALVAGLQAERDRLKEEVDTLQRQQAEVTQDNADLNDALDELQANTDARLDVVEAQREELTREHLLALQENQLLRLRLESIPACTAWGYVIFPRPQTSPPSRRVVVSDRTGAVFRSELDCARVRQGDPTAASPCLCVGSVWGAGE